MQDAQVSERDALQNMSRADLIDTVLALRGGRTKGFDQAKFDYVIEQMINGRSARSVFRHEQEGDEENAPSRRTFYRWLANPDLDKKFDLKRQHDFAFMVRSMEEFDYMFEIADDGRNDWMEELNKDGDFIGWRENGESTRRSAIRIDMRKFALERMNKGRFSSKAGSDSSMSTTVHTKTVRIHRGEES